MYNFIKQKQLTSKRGIQFRIQASNQKNAKMALIDLSVVLLTGCLLNSNKIKLRKTIVSELILE